MKVVLDTNVVLSALLFKNGKLIWLREAWESKLFLPCLNSVCAEELLRALAYPKFRLMPDDIQTLLGAYLPFVQIVDSGIELRQLLPQCTDPHDQKFLVLAHVAEADVLVSGDHALLALSGTTPFRIATPRQFAERLGIDSSGL